MKQKIIAVVGIGDDGCSSLSSRAFSAISQARVLVGGKRHLAFFPEFSGKKIAITGAIDAVLAAIADERLQANVCVLASGDPLFYGIGQRLLEHFGRDEVEFFLQPSSVQWALAKVGLDSAEVMPLSFHGRPLRGLTTRLAFFRHAALLTDANNTPQKIAQHLLHFGAAGFRMWVAENLGGPGERVRAYSVDELSHIEEVSPLNIVVLERRDPTWRPAPWLSYLAEDFLDKRMPKQGLVTKREVRVASLAALRLTRQSVVWDIGTGCGSVAIEAGRLAFEGDVWAIDVDPTAVAITQGNARAFGIDNLTVIEGRAPQDLADFPEPDAVFIGGSKGSMAEILDFACARARPGAWLVANAITLENQGQAYAWARARNLVPEIVLHTSARAQPLAHYMRYDALNPVQIMAVQKPFEVSA